jgi:hypothetical protein
VAVKSRPSHRARCRRMRWSDRRYRSPTAHRPGDLVSASWCLVSKSSMLTRRVQYRRPLPVTVGMSVQRVSRTVEVSRDSPRMTLRLAGQNGRCFRESAPIGCGSLLNARPCSTSHKNWSRARFMSAFRSGNAEERLTACRTSSVNRDQGSGPTRVDRCGRLGFTSRGRGRALIGCTGQPAAVPQLRHRRAAASGAVT